ncbi:MAG: hypothetical protein PHU55_04535 [Bacilli bacterium]|nr:hypothetical protein [Bacilli bacterium]
MNKFNKVLFSTLSLLTLTAMASCGVTPTTTESGTPNGSGASTESGTPNGSGASTESEIPVADAVANQRVMAAMEQMVTTEIESFQIDVVADVLYSQKSYDADNVILFDRSLDADGEVHIKANDIFGDNAVASVLASASASAVENEETLFDIEGEVALYLSEGWAYVDISGAADAYEMYTGQVPPLTTFKTEVGNLGEAIGYDPEIPFEMPIDFADMVPYANLLSNVEATEKNGELTVVYTITIDDIVNVMMKVMQDGGQIPAEATAEQIAAMRAQILAMISQVINITTAKLTIGVGADGFISKLYVDVDIAVTIEQGEEEEVGALMSVNEAEIDHELHELDGFLHIDISKMNQTVDVELPTNLDTYTDINSLEQPA